MKRRIRHRAMKWLYDSRIGHIAWIVDTAGETGCRLVGCEAFDTSPDQCRYCGADLTATAARRPPSKAWFALGLGLIVAAILTDLLALHLIGIAVLAVTAIRLTAYLWVTRTGGRR